jgi:hypothetical protein
MRPTTVVTALVLAVGIASTVAAQQLHEVVVNDVMVAGNDLRGELINRSDKEIRDVRLLVRRPWLWTRETEPGEDSPGRADYETIPGPIPPRGRLAFTVRPLEPLSVRSDGHFSEASVEVVGFTAVGS